MTGQHTGHCEVRGNKEYWTQASTVMYGDNKEFSVLGQHPYDPEHVILPEIMKDDIRFLRGMGLFFMGKCLQTA